MIGLITFLAISLGFLVVISLCMAAGNADRKLEELREREKRNK